MKSLFCCPLCAAPLERTEGVYACPTGHRYDVAREGYVHLLPANRLHSKTPGDDKAMAAARGRFLSGEHYAHLKLALANLALEYAPDHPAVLDSGCGEGYYTAAVHAALRETGKGPFTAGVDLSKPSLKHAAKREREAEFAVASVYHLPVPDRSVDLLLNCFSPLAIFEFRRVLRPGGVLLYVVPGPRHLWEMKEVLYDRLYENPEETVAYEGFEHLEIRSPERVMILNGQDIMDLFTMTPYAWKTPKAGVERLAALGTLNVCAQFRVHVFRKSE